MTEAEERHMDRTIRLAVAESMAPLEHRVTVLETQQASAGKLLWIAATAAAAGIVSAIYGLLTGK